MIRCFGKLAINPNGSSDGSILRGEFRLVPEGQTPTTGMIAWVEIATGLELPASVARRHGPPDTTLWTRAAFAIGLSFPS